MFRFINVIRFCFCLLLPVTHYNVMCTYVIYIHEAVDWTPNKTAGQLPRAASASRYYADIAISINIMTQIANTAAARSLALVCTYESNYCCNNLGLRCGWLLIRGEHHDTVTVKLKLLHLLPVVDGNGNGNSLVISP